MSAIDIVILVVVILIILAIIFFNYILPMIKGVPAQCSSCPTAKRAKKILKQYRKKYRNK